MFHFFKKKIPAYLNGIKIHIAKNAMIDDNCQIGSYTYVGFNTAITKAKVGRYVSIGSNVSIGMGEHDLSKISTSTIFYKTPYEDLTKGDCIIGHDVWIGVGAIIRRGVYIGNGAVVAANSFVNKDVPDFAIVAGSPAKIIKYRFDEEMQKKIAESQWWNYDKEQAQGIIDGLERNIG